METHSNDNERRLSPHDLARKHADALVAAIVERFAIQEPRLSLLLDDEAGVYMSDQEPDTLCGLVLDERDGHMYVVTAKVAPNGRELSDFKSDLLS